MNEDARLPRRGVIEIELLRRYGRVPVGTRAVGWFAVSECPGPYMTHTWEVRIPVGDDPRVVGGQMYFPWQKKSLHEPYTRTVFHRGAPLTVSSTDFFDMVVQDVVRFVEAQDTSAKHQRFRVVRAAWDDQDREARRS